MIYTPFKTAQDSECLIHLGETPESIHWDYKQSFSPKKSEDFAVDLSAFANTYGGTLLIGVAEKSDGAKKVASGFVPSINVEEIKKIDQSQFATSNLVDAKIANKIVVLRGVQVMIDRDIAELYGVEIKVLNQAVKRNAERFPKQFMFQLSLDEYRSVKESLWSQFVTIENIGDLRGRHSKYLPHAFTEQGVAMLSAVSHLKKWKILKL